MTEQEWLTGSDPRTMLRFATDHPRLHACSDRKLRLFAVAYCRLRWNEFDALSRDHVEQVERYADGEGSLPAYDPRVHVVAWSASHLDVLTSATACLDTSPQVRKQQADLLCCIIGNPYRPAYVVQTKAEDFARANGHIAFEWLTPQVVSLAGAAYEDRPGKACEMCQGVGSFDADEYSPASYCSTCRGTGRVEDGLLDPLRLAVLADALEEAGCPCEVEELGEAECGECSGNGFISYADYFAEDGMGPEEECNRCNGSGTVEVVSKVPHPLLAHLRSPGPHVRGCHAVDLCLGKS